MGSGLPLRRSVGVGRFAIDARGKELSSASGPIILENADTMVALIVSCFFAAILGFAAHRASVCTVRAVTEFVFSRTGYMFLSIAKSSIWVLVVTFPFFWLMPVESAKLSGWGLTDVAVLGGFVFGLGAALTGACALSSMARMLGGELMRLLARRRSALAAFSSV